MMKTIAFCGNDCEKCPRYRATKSGDAGELRRVAELWYRNGLRDRVVAPEEIACDGCSPDKSCVHAVAACAAAKGLSHCGRCAEFPCARVEAMFARTEEFSLQ